MDEIKEWKVENSRSKAASVLMFDGVAFRFSPETGFVFTAPEYYVKNLKERLTVCHGISKPIINELK